MACQSQHKLRRHGASDSGVYYMGPSSFGRSQPGDISSDCGMDPLRGRQHFRTVPLAPATAHPHRECNGKANPWLEAFRVDSGANHLELRGTGVPLGCLEAEFAAANGKTKNGAATDAVDGYSEPMAFQGCVRFGIWVAKSSVV